MLVPFGRTTGTVDLVDLLLACHERIRRFLVQARRLATTTAPDAERAEVAGQIRRYFADAFPIHVADENEDLVPHLAKSSPEIDDALATMTSDHEFHKPVIDRLVELTGAIERDPHMLSQLANELEGLALALSTDLVPHLELEERILFPAVERLPVATQDAIRHRMHERRR